MTKLIGIIAIYSGMFIIGWYTPRTKYHGAIIGVVVAYLLGISMGVILWGLK